MLAWSVNVVSASLNADSEEAVPTAGRRDRRGRRLRHLQKIIETSYQTALQRLTFDGLTIELLCVADVDGLLDRLPRIQFRPDERLPYWADLWPSAMALARHLWHATDLHGLQVLELGCGLGLTGIVASRKGAAVTLTDYEADALAFARYNALQNDCKEATVRHLDWHAPALTEAYALIIASDVLYERANFQPILHILQTALAPNGRFLLAEPNRPIARDFFRLLRDHEFRYERTTAHVEVNSDPHEVSIYYGARNIDWCGSSRSWTRTHRGSLSQGKSTAPARDIVDLGV
jgi:predicted nicotinamide N-methyase